MTDFVIRLRRTRFPFLAILILVPMVAHGQYTGVWVDASSPVYTAGYNGDMCKAINNAYLSGNFRSGSVPGAFTGTIDARGFAGLQACNSNPFAGANNSVQLLLNCNVEIVTSVGWLTPQLAHEINGCIAATLATGTYNVGAILAACGPGLSTLWMVNKCIVPVQGYASPVTVNPISVNLTFNVPHGPFPGNLSGENYVCLICDGAQGDPNATPSYYGWNKDGFGSHITNLKLDLGGNSNIFGLYTLNEQELSEWRDIQCGGFQNGTSGLNAEDRACWFIDRTENSNTTVAGPGNFVVDQVQLGADNTMQSVADYGGVLEGSNITIEFTNGTCANPPIAAVTAVIGGVIQSIRLISGGNCTTAPTNAGVVAYYPSTSGSFVACATSSQCWSNSPVTTGGATFGVGGGGGGGMGNPITLTLTGGGTGYPLGFFGLMKSVSNMTFTNGSSTYDITGGILIDGFSVERIDNIHCEHMTGDCLAAGTFEYQQGGEFANINSNYTVSGATVHLGGGIDNGQVVIDSVAIPVNTTPVTVLRDDANLVNSSSLILTTGIPSSGSTCTHVLALYLPGSLTSCSNGVVLPNTVMLGMTGATLGSLVFNSATSGGITVTPPTGSLSGTNTLQSVSDTFVYRTTTDTITNKTISGSANTLTNIGNSSLANSSLTVGVNSPITGGGSVALGATSTPVGCPTCVTSSGGGALTATSPVTVSGAGLIAISGVTGEQGNGSKLQLSTGTVNANAVTKFDSNGNTINSSLVDSGTLVTTSEVLQAGNTIRLTADSAGITATSPGTTVFTTSTLPTNRNYTLHCSGAYSQSAGTGGVGIAVQGATNAPTRLDAWGWLDSTNTSYSGSKGSAIDIINTTATSVVSVTPGAVSMIYQWGLDATIQVGSNTSTLNVLFYTGNSSDAVIVKAGSYCTAIP